MGYVSFYRKWRPQNFDEVIGQKYVVQTLKNAVSKNRLSHAYMFCGPRGTGKTSTARILAKALNCVDGPTSEPCNKCANCISISNGNSVDVIEIDAASNRGINEIRELREKAKYLPNILRKKVYIIDEVHMLTPEAFNALLKILEEPPEHVLFIMATTEPRKVIPTIMSRCQRFDFYPIPVDMIKKRLAEISESENIPISDSVLDIISKYADGSQRDADGILEQLVSLGGDDINVSDVVSLLGVVDLELLFELTNILIEKDLTQGLLFIYRIINSNQNLKVFVSEFLDHLYNLYAIKNYDKPLEILDISLSYKDKYMDQSSRLSLEELEFFMDLFTDTYKQVRWGEGSKTIFKTAMVKAISYNAIKGSQIDKRIKMLESEIALIKNEAEGTVNHDSNKKSKFEKDGKPEVIENSKDKNAKDAKSKESVVSSKNFTNLKDEEKLDSGDAKKSKKNENTGSSGKKGNKKDTIYNNWDNINLKLKKRKISVHAMFAEVKHFEVKGNVLSFYLGSNKKWHRDHLNRAANVKLISKIVEEVTGKSYMIKFELGKDGEKDTAKKKSSTELTGYNLAETAAEDKNQHMKVSENTKMTKEDEIFDYFEKKFEIKEQ